MARNRILMAVVIVLLLRPGDCVDIMMGIAATEDLKEGYIVSPGYPSVLTEAMRVRCQLRKISNNPTTMVTLTEDHIDFFDARGRCREKMEINFYPDNTQNRVFCSGHEHTFGSAYTLQDVNHKIDIDFNKCDSLQGGQFRLQFTGNYNVRVECFERQDPDPFNCPTTTTTTTERPTTEVQQQTTTSQNTGQGGKGTGSGSNGENTENTGQDGKGTGSGSNGENTESDSSDRTNLYIIIGGVAGGALLICIIIILVVCLLRGRDDKQKDASMVVSQSSGTEEKLYENVAATKSNGQATVDPEKGQAKYSSSVTETENSDSAPMYVQVDKSKKSTGSRNRQDASVGD